MMQNVRLGAFAVMGMLPLAAAATLAPHLAMVRLPDRESEQVWSAQLDRDLGPVMADCVRFDVSGHVAPASLDAMLARAGGDVRLYPYLQHVTDAAFARCRRRHAD